MDKRNFLAACRAKKGLSQKEVSEILGYTPQLISKWEASESFPDMSSWGAICRLYDIDLKGLLEERECLDSLACNQNEFSSASFSSYLISLRKKKGVRQIDVASFLGANVKTVSSYEKGKSLPNKKAFLSLCSFFGQNYDSLYFGKLINEAQKESKPIEDMPTKRKAPPFLIPILAVVACIGATLSIALPLTLSRLNPKENEFPYDSIEGSFPNEPLSGEAGSQLPSLVPKEGSSPPSNPSSAEPAQDAYPDFFPTKSETEDALCLARKEARKYVDPSLPCYLITFLDEDGSELKKETCQEGLLPKGVDTSRLTHIDKGKIYYFKKWDKEIEKACKNQTYNAIYASFDYEESPFSFSLEEDGNGFALLSCLEQEEITIPSSYLGLPIIRIGDGALSGLTTVKRVRIEEGVEEIGDGFLSSCPNLEEIILPSTLKRIGHDFLRHSPNASFLEDGLFRYLPCKDDSFFLLYDCKKNSVYSSEVLAKGKIVYSLNIENVDTIRFENEVRFLNLDYFDSAPTSSDAILPKEYLVDSENYTASSELLYSEGGQTLSYVAPGEKESELTLLSSIQRIGPNAFSGAKNLANLILQSEAISLPMDAFKDAPRLNTISFGAAEVILEDGALLSSPALNRYLVDEDSPSLSEEDGILYSKDKSILYSAPAEKKIDDFIAPLATNEVAPFAFYQSTCYGVKSLENVKTIGQGAFFSSRLRNLVIDGPSSIQAEAMGFCDFLEEFLLYKETTYIGEGAIDYASMLSKIVYEGTKEEFNNLPKHENWNKGTSALRVSCSDGVLLFQ